MHAGGSGNVRFCVRVNEGTRDEMRAGSCRGPESQEEVWMEERGDIHVLLACVLLKSQ